MMTKLAVLIAPAPSPWMNRPPISWAIDAAAAATTSPAANSARPAIIGRAGPIRSLSRPVTTVAKSIPIRNSENDQA